MAVQMALEERKARLAKREAALEAEEQKMQAELVATKNITRQVELLKKQLGSKDKKLSDAQDQIADLQRQVSTQYHQQHQDRLQHQLEVLDKVHDAAKNASEHAKKELMKIKNKTQARRNRRWQEGDCFINTLIATEKLALAAASIDSAVMSCVPGHAKKSTCAGDVAGIYAAFAAAADYLAAVAGTCPKAKTNEKAMCASNIANINYGIGTLASAFATLDDKCLPPANEKTPPIKPGHPAQNSMAMCVINAAEAAAYIGHAVLTVRAATRDCPEGLQASCAADISGAIQSFALVEAYLANAAALCGETTIVAAVCANRVGSIVAGLAEVSGGSSGANINCGDPGVTHGNRFLDPDGQHRGAR